MDTDLFDTAAPLPHTLSLIRYLSYWRNTNYDIQTTKHKIKVGMYKAALIVLVFNYIGFRRS